MDNLLNPVAGVLAPHRFPLPDAVPEFNGEADAGLLRMAFGRPCIPEAAFLRLADAARLVHCHDGPLLLSSPRRPEASWWLVRRGRMDVGHRLASGALLKMRCIGAGEWLDVAGALSRPGTWLEHASCKGPVDLLAVPLSSIYEECAHSPVFAQAFGEVLATRVRDLNERLTDMATTEVRVRFARWLVRQIDPAEQGQPPVCVTLHDRKQSIACQLGITSETLSRTLRQFIDEGILEVNGYEVIVHRLQALRQLAQAQCAGRRSQKEVLPT